MYENLKLDFQRGEGKLLVVRDEDAERIVAFLTPKTAEQWDHRIDGLIAWLEGVHATYAMMRDDWGPAITADTPAPPAASEGGSDA